MLDSAHSTAERFSSANGARLGPQSAGFETVSPGTFSRATEPQTGSDGRAPSTGGGQYTSQSDCKTVQIALSAEIAALVACVGQRKPRVREEIDAYLNGARDLLGCGTAPPPDDGEMRVRVAARLFSKANSLYYGYVQKTNRLYYVGGVLVGALLVAAIAPFALYFGALGLAQLLAATHSEGASVFQAVDLPALLVLFGFAALGSTVSVLSRLDKLVVPSVFTRELVVVSGLGRPLVAAVFATVVYALVSGKIVNIVPDGSAAINPHSIVHWWCVVIAFLCGYSERFASDLLGHSTVGMSIDPAATEVRTPADGVQASRQG
jgi:hypothetical protein